MEFKAVFVICASTLFVQCVYSQCVAGLAAPYGFPGVGLAGSSLIGAGLAGAYGAGCGGVTSTGGGLPVTSFSPIAPTGVYVVSENAYEGTLAAGGNLPFLSTVVLEGVLPTAGAGAVSYGCGDGAVGITAEAGPVATGIAPAAAGLSYNGLGYNGLGSNGLGYNSLGYNGLVGVGYGPAGCGAIY